MNEKTDPEKLTYKIMSGCLLFKEILDTGVTLHDAWEIAAPYVLPLLESASNLLTPETFWYHGVMEALKRPSFEQVDFVQQHFQEIQGQEGHFVDRLKRTAESDRAMISGAYDDLISALRKAYPDVPLRGL